MKRKWLPSAMDDVVRIGESFETSHKPKHHTATIANSFYGPFTSEIALVEAIPVILRNCVHVSTNSNSVESFTHVWKRTR